jgi:hypothetical protein
MGHLTVTGERGVDTSELLERTRAVLDDVTFRSGGP